STFTTGPATVNQHGTNFHLRHYKGWPRHQENGAKPPYRRRRGGVPCPRRSEHHPVLAKADAARYFLDRSEFAFLKWYLLGQLCLGGGESVRFEFIHTFYAASSHNSCTACGRGYTLPPHRG